MGVKKTYIDAIVELMRIEKYIDKKNEEKIRIILSNNKITENDVIRVYETFERFGTDNTFSVIKNMIER